MMVKIDWCPKPAPPHLTFRSQVSQTAYDNAVSAASPCGLLPQADKYWCHNGAHLPFGSSYHAWFPSTWARHVLGATLNWSITSHLYRSIHFTPERRQSASSHAPPYPLAIGKNSRRVPASRSRPLQHSSSSRRVS